MNVHTITQITVENALQVRQLQQIGRGIPYQITFIPDGDLAVLTPAGIYFYSQANVNAISAFRPLPEVFVNFAFNHDASLLALSTRQGEIHIWDAATWSERFILQGHGDAVLSLTFSADGQWLASSSLDSTMRLWDLSQRSIRVVFSHSGDLFQNLLGGSKNPTRPPASVAFSPDSQLLAFDQINTNSQIVLWDIGKNIIRSTLGGQDYVRALAFSPDGKQLLSQSNSEVSVWDVQTGHLAKTTIANSMSWLVSMAVSPDNTTLAAGMSDGRIQVFDLVTGNTRGTVQAHRDNVETVAFDTNRLASLSYDGTVKIWDVGSLTLLATLTDHFSTDNAVISSDGNFVAFADEDDSNHGQISLWKQGSPYPTLFASDLYRIKGLAIAPGSTLLSAGSRDGNIYSWDLKTIGLKLHMHDFADVWTVAFSPDGLTLASGGYNNAVALWNTGTGKLRASLDVFVTPDVMGLLTISVLVYSPDGNHLFIGTNQFYSPPDGQLLKGGPQHAVGEIWNMKKVALRNSLDIVALSAAFSPDSHLLVIGTTTGGLEFWNPITVQQEQRIQVTGGAVTSLAFNQDGSVLASGHADGAISLWDVEHKTALATLRGHALDVTALRFANNGLLISASADGTIRLWGIAAATTLDNAPFSSLY